MPMQRKALTLYELNCLVRDVIEATFDTAYWVEAEVSEVREVHGHCYMELVQKDLFAATPVARASAKCWRTTWSRLKPKFERATGQPLHAGMKVMLAVTANFHEAYGFSWIVQDIDPTYTMGDMAKKRLEIINQLKAEGVFDMQKSLELPMFAQHIAVISSAGAAGYGDFCHQLQDNEEGLWFCTELFPAVMQGEDVEPTIIAALNAINERIDEFDAVVIIRGGGATADMSGFDTLKLAENVANFPIPVITGIGHDRDESVLDMVSHTRVKTPTAAAAFLVDHLYDVWLHINDCQSRLVSMVNHRLEMEKERINRLTERIPTLFSLVKEQQMHFLDMKVKSITFLIQARIQNYLYEVEKMEDSLFPMARNELMKHRIILESLDSKARMLDPMLVLQRGYSITRANGKVVSDATRLKKGDVLTTQFEKGTIESEVV